MDELLKDVKNYLDITYVDEETDKKITGIIERGKKYLDNIAGEQQEYGAENTARQLLFDYCRYVNNGVFELFEENFKSELIMLRIGVDAHDYAERQGYVSDI